MTLMGGAADEVYRFWSFVNRRGPNECWPWTGAVAGQGGYGSFRISNPRKRVYAHRMSLCIKRGIDIRELNFRDVVRHTCHNPICVNPSHLRIGSQKDNIRDQIERGTKPKPNARLTEDDVRMIRARTDAGEMHRVIAADFGLMRRHVGKIAPRTIWRDVI